MYRHGTIDEAKKQRVRQLPRVLITQYNILQIKMLEDLLGSKIRAKALGWLFTHPEERFFVRQLASLIKEDSTNVSRELARLEKARILISSNKGRRKYFWANQQNPVFPAIRDLVSHESSPTPLRFPISASILDDFCRRHHIRRLSLFGSVLRRDFGPNSDVDVLVEFETGHVPGFGMVDLENELSKMIGRKVDLRTPGDLSRFFRDRILNEAQVEYAATDA